MSRRAATAAPPAARRGSVDRLEAEVGSERERLVDLVDRPDGHARGAQHLHPVLGRLRPEHGLELGSQRVDVRHPRLVAREPLVSRQPGQPDRLAQAREQPVVADRHRERAVGGLVGLIRHDARVAVAAAPRHRPARHPRRALVEQRGQRRVHQRHLDVAAAALGQRRLDPDRGEQAADEVDDGRAGLQRAPVRLAGDAHQAAHGLEQEVVARHAARLLAAPERGDRAGDEAGVDAPDRVAVEVPRRHQPGPERLDQHVRALGQRARQLAVAGVGEVEHDRALVAIEPEEVRADPVAPRRPPGAGVVARARPLDLDHVGAEVAEQHRRVRAREDAREVGDDQAFQRSAHRGSPH